MHAHVLSLIFGAALRSVHAADIVFPPLAPLGPPFAGQSVLAGGHAGAQKHISDDMLLAQATDVMGLTTFANLPHVFCLDRAQDVEAYDIAFLGAPFDTVSGTRTPRDVDPLTLVSTGRNSATRRAIWTGRNKGRIEPH